MVINLWHYLTSPVQSNWKWTLIFTCDCWVNRRVSSLLLVWEERKGMMVGFLPNLLLEQTPEQTKTSMSLVVVSHPASDIILTRQLNSQAHMWKSGIFYKFCTIAVMSLLLLHNTAPTTHGLGHMEDHIEPKSVYTLKNKRPCCLQYGLFFHRMWLKLVSKFFKYLTNTHRQRWLKM